MVSDGTISRGISPGSDDPLRPLAATVVGGTTTDSLSTTTVPPLDPLSSVPISASPSQTSSPHLNIVISLLQSLLSPPYNLSPEVIADLLSPPPLHSSPSDSLFSTSCWVSNYPTPMAAAASSLAAPSTSAAAPIPFLLPPPPLSLALYPANPNPNSPAAAAAPLAAGAFFSQSAVLVMPLPSLIPHFDYPVSCFL